MRAGILQCFRRIDLCETTDEIVPEKDFEMCRAIRTHVHEPHPRQNRRCLE